ncbi:MAG: LytR/AlgR family response regulator transcription factor [Flammeovirgaceae bacterium]
MIKCLIIDDEPLAIQIITQHLEQLPDFELVHTFQNPIDGFNFLKTTPIDLLFLDIQMPLLTGIDLIKSLENPPPIIFTTAHRNYAIESYELDVVDYLLKPIAFTRFFKAINKFKSLRQIPVPSTPIQHAEPTNDHLYVNANKRYIKVLFAQINYVESIKDYIRIHSGDQTIITKEKISEFEQKLPHGFLRIHRSFIVNLAKISAFTSKDVEIGEQEIPIGESYKKLVINVLRGK